MICLYTSNGRVIPPWLRTCTLQSTKANCQIEIHIIYRCSDLIFVTFVLFISLVGLMSNFPLFYCLQSNALIKRFDCALKLLTIFLWKKLCVLTTKVAIVIAAIVESSLYACFVTLTWLGCVVPVATPALAWTFGFQWILNKIIMRKRWLN